MKVSIVTEGGKNAGFGHITRCTSIYQAFEEVGIHSKLIVNGDETVRDFVRLGHPLRDCKIFDWLNKQETLFSALRDADIVIIDSYLADYDLYERISNIAGIGVYLDDNIRVEYPKGFVLNGTIFAERMPYPEGNGVRYLLGTQYTPLRREFWEVPEKAIHAILETVMITLGGADIRNLTPRILKLLQSTHLELFKKVIIGKGFQNTIEIESLKDRNTELIYYPDAAEMKKIMLESDIAISASGQTLYELARTGVPAIGICTAENQSRNIKEWADTGFLEYLGWYDCERFEQKLKSRLEHLEDRHTRMNMSQAGRKVIDGQGCKRILNAIELNR